MKEPEKIPLDPDRPLSKEPKKIPLTTSQHLYDDFGYLLSIEKTYPDNMKDDTYLRSDINHENSENSH
jgi:hypothetical protein